MSETKHIPANCDMALSGRGFRRCKWAGIVETEDGRMVCGHHARMIAEDLVELDLARHGLKLDRRKPLIPTQTHAIPDDDRTLADRLDRIISG